MSILDPKIEIIGPDPTNPRTKGCHGVDNTTASWIESSLNLALGNLASCPGGLVFSNLFDYYLPPGEAPRPQKICVRPPKDRDTIACVRQSFKHLDNGGEGIIYISDSYLDSCKDDFLRGFDCALSIIVYHELFHLGYPEDIQEFKRQAEIDAYACDFSCAGGGGLHSYPCGEVSDWLGEECRYPGGWEKAFGDGAIDMNGCPTPPDAHPCQTCQPHVDPVTGEVTAECERCCPPGGVNDDPECNPNMQCWIDFAPQSPRGELEREQLKSMVCDWLEISKKGCDNLYPPTLCQA